MKVLFLDFDGVVTATNGSYANENMIDDVSLFRLHTVLDQTGTKIVVSSSWRHGRSTQELAQILKLDPTQVVGKTRGGGETANSSLTTTTEGGRVSRCGCSSMAKMSTISRSWTTTYSTYTPGSYPIPYRQTLKPGSRSPTGTT